MAAVASEILGELFPSRASAHKKKGVSEKRHACFYDEIQIHDNEKLVAKLETKKLEEFFQSLYWENPPLVSLERLSKLPKKLRMVGYAATFSIFPERIWSFLKRLEYWILGTHCSKSNTIVICPRNIWEASQNSLCENEARYQRMLLWTLAHELGHAWHHKQKHWSHERPWPFRILFFISRTFEGLFSNWLGWLAVAAGFPLCLFLHGHQRIEFLHLLIYFWLVVFAGIGLDSVFFPIMAEVKADQSAAAFLNEHKSELSKCLYSRKEPGVVGTPNKAPIIITQ